jgi:lipopolysaccharide/colanic/teichoic acid biosynthesis glycosyltransferase
LFKSIFEYREKQKPLKYIEEPVLEYIIKFINPFQNQTRILDTSTIFNIESINDPIENFINLRKLNYITNLNSLFFSINEKLYMSGYYIGCVELYQQRKERIYSRFPLPISFVVYFTDFIFNRMFPKLYFTQNIRIKKLRTTNRALSKTEIFGRLYASGFDVVNFEDINNLTYFVARKKDNAKIVNEYKYGLLYKMNRIGKKGKIITVYKIRTMNPYSEYLQNYVYDNYNLKEGGKFKNDFRITPWGKFLRKYWLDELPMIFNLIKGDIKLVGVRPLSKQYFDLYDDDLKSLRYKHKPGLIPPYYADLPKSIEEIIESEKKYLTAYEKHKIKTDIIYLYKALKNIFFNKARSS